MKFKSTFLIFILVIAFTFSCSQKEEHFTVDIIHNKGPQWGDDPKIELEFVQKIGALEATDENYIMYNIWDVGRDSDGNIYILDSGDSRIQKFDPQGEYLTTIGGPGEGPGEFKNPVSLNLDRDGRMYIGDFGKNHYIILDNKGKELRRFRQEHFIHKSRILPGKKLIYGGLYNQGVGMLSRYEELAKTGYYNLFHIIDEEGKNVHSFGEMDIYKEENMDAIFTNANAPFDVDRNGNIYIAYRYRNLIEKRDSGGKILLVFDRLLNFKETGYLFDFTFETYSNSISTHVAVDTKDRVWIITVIEQPDEWREQLKLSILMSVKKSAAVFEIYNSEGILLGSLPLPEDIFLFRIFDDRLLIVDPDRVSVSEYRIIDK